MYFKMESLSDDEFFNLKKNASLSPVVINKRENDVCEVKKVLSSELHIPGHYGDRFIPRRYALRNLNKVESFNKKSKEFFAIFNENRQEGYWRSHNLKIELNNILGIKKRRILQLSDPHLHHWSIESQIYFSTSAVDWPCHPRSKPLAVIDSTHDLPGFNIHIEMQHNIIDWSANGLIAASFGNEFVVWDPIGERTVVERVGDCKAISFSPNGKYLAVSFIRGRKPALRLYDVAIDGVLRNYKNFKFQSKNSDITSLAWSKCGKALVCGTMSGHLYIFDPTMSMIKIKKIEIHNAPIVLLKFSPQMKYLATGDENDNVYFSFWESIASKNPFFSKGPQARSFDWHPWNGVEVVMSENCPPSICIYNVDCQKLVSYYLMQQHLTKNLVIYEVSFNKISAELAVSYSMYLPSSSNQRSPTFTEIVILAAFDKVVECLRGHDEYIQSMVWSPDGKQLGTAGADEVLTIWNFFSTKDNGKTIKKEKNDKNFSNKVKSIAFASTFTRLNVIR